jgi:hypothetical protein
MKPRDIALVDVYDYSANNKCITSAAKEEPSDNGLMAVLASLLGACWARAADYTS